jgi:uncharacterized membrane protein HdeD (DUF308 family)
VNPFVAVDDPEVRTRMARLWWLTLIMGILWVLISLVVLSFSPTSVAAIGYLMGFVLLVAGLTELAEAVVVAGWRWVHAVLAVLFLIVGVAALLEPFQTFGILALLIGWYLVIRGTFEVVFSLVTRRDLPLWGLLLAAGIIEIGIGVWAIGSPARSAWLLILWVGIAAMMRGITEIVLGIHLHADRERLAVA